MDATMDEARVILRARRHDSPGKADSFDMENNSNLMSIFADLTGTFFAAMIGIAAISMVVGGIVIMNIMLVSVTERTREVGIRKAMGARRSDVLLQFLIEAVILSLLGGVVGVLLGIAVAKGVTLAVGMPSVIKLWAVFAGLIVAASVGVFFGVYPRGERQRSTPSWRCGLKHRDSVFISCSVEANSVKSSRWRWPPSARISCAPGSPCWGS